jgi:hypothetical protein
VKGALLRTLITLVALTAALVTFMTIRNAWFAAAIIVTLFILTAILGHLVWRRFSDLETRRRDLEDRVRNWFP